MIKIVNNEVDIYKTEKRLEDLRIRSNKRKQWFKQKPSDLEIEIEEKKLERLKLFHQSNVVICKYDSYGQFPFLFNDRLRIIMMPYSNGDSKVFSYDDIEKVQILPNYIQQEYVQTTTKKKGGITRAVVGGALFGTVGAVVGSTTAGSRSRSTSTQYTTFNNYNFFVWLKNGESYFASNIPSKGFFEKKPPKELKDLEFYFNKIITDGSTNYETESGQQNADKDSIIISNEKYMNGIQIDEVKVKKTIKRQRILYGILYSFMAFWGIIALIIFCSMVIDFFEWLS